MIMKRLWIALLAIPVCLISVLIVGAQRSHPANAGGVIDPTCISSLACIEYDNNGTGPAIRGVALKGNGVSGSTHLNSTSTTNSRAGVLGKDDSGLGTFNSGVSGLSVHGTGVSGGSTSGRGVSGQSTSGPGVSGTSSSGDGVDGSGATGVLGSGSNIGVLGSGSTGVQGNGIGGGAGVSGNSQTGPGVVGSGYAGVAAFTTFSNGSALVVQDQTGLGYLIGGFDINDDREFAVFDDGTVQAHAYTTQLATSAGPKVTTYTPQASAPTIEDFGEAQLSNGTSYVRIDSRFAGTMAQASYFVFITPEGDNRGLYVTQKSPTGFAVHESQGGHSTLAFSYRIVAKPFGNQAPRLPLFVEHRVPKVMPRPHN